MRFTEEQIIRFPKQTEASVQVKELCRKHGFSDASFYKWRKKCGGISVPHARCLRELEAENAKLKKLLVESLSMLIWMPCFISKPMNSLPGRCSVAPVKWLSSGNASLVQFERRFVINFQC